MDRTHKPGEPRVWRPAHLPAPRPISPWQLWVGGLFSLGVVLGIFYVCLDALYKAAVGR